MSGPRAFPRAGQNAAHVARTANTAYRSFSPTRQSNRDSLRPLQASGAIYAGPTFTVSVGCTPRTLGLHRTAVFDAHRRDPLSYPVSGGAVRSQRTGCRAASSANQGVGDSGSHDQPGDGEHWPTPQHPASQRQSTARDQRRTRATHHRHGHRPKDDQGPTHPTITILRHRHSDPPSPGSLSETPVVLRRSCTLPRRAMSSALRRRSRERSQTCPGGEDPGPGPPPHMRGYDRFRYNVSREGESLREGSAA